MSKAVVIASVSVALLAGCSASYRQQRIGNPSQSLDRSKTVYVAVPADGGYGGKPALGSGQQVAQSLAAAFSQVGVDTKLAEKHEERDAVLAAARNSGASYVAEATLANWEQRATEWSMRPSRLSVTVRILDASTGKPIDTTVLDSRSRVMSLTSTSPASLVKGSITAYVRGLYSPAVAPTASHASVQ